MQQLSPHLSFLGGLANHLIAWIHSTGQDERGCQKRRSLGAVCALIFFWLVIGCTESSSEATSLMTALPPGATSKASARLEPLRSESLRRQLKDNSADITVLNLWATWCEPCKEEMPELVRFHKMISDEPAAKSALAGQNVALLLVSADAVTDRPEVIKFLNSFQIDFPTYILQEDPQRFAKALAPTWSATLPTTFLFDRSGRVISFWVGKTTLVQLLEKIRSASRPARVQNTSTPPLQRQ